MELLYVENAMINELQKDISTQHYIQKFLRDGITNNVAPAGLRSTAFTVSCAYGYAHFTPAALTQKSRRDDRCITVSAALAQLTDTGVSSLNASPAWGDIINRHQKP